MAVKDLESLPHPLLKDCLKKALEEFSPKTPGQALDPQDLPYTPRQPQDPQDSLYRSASNPLDWDSAQSYR